MNNTAELSIEAIHITKKFGLLTAVEDLCLSISPGICFGLLGPNGAGKTTFIEILEGILTPTRGEVHYKGKPRRASFKEHIGIMFQNTALLSYLTVSETLAAFRTLYRQSGWNRPDNRSVSSQRHPPSVYRQDFRRSAPTFAAGAGADQSTGSAFSG